jgi:hypothetical protein
MKDLNMKTIGELKYIVDYINREFGSDCPVIIQFYNGDKIEIGTYASEFICTENGSLFITNKTQIYQ